MPRACLHLHALGALLVLLPQAAFAQGPQILWWHDLDSPSLGSAAVADIDFDGTPEIVFGTYWNDERIVALNAEDGSTLWDYFTDSCNDASPIIADIDFDDTLEVVVPASATMMVYCFSGPTGAVEWSTSTGYPNCIDSPPAIADVDNDGLLEVILGAWHGKVFCLNAEDGSICWQIDLGYNSYIQAGPAVLDVDGNDSLDVVVAEWAGAYRVYALKGQTGSTLWYSDEPDDHMYHAASFADVDEDGSLELAIGAYDSHVYLLNAEDGSVEWEYELPYYVGAPTVSADLDNDGHLEIVAAAYNRVVALSHTGSSQWTYTAGGSIFRGAAIADLDGNGILDVVFGCDDGVLRALRGHTGTLLGSVDLGAHYGNTFDMDHAPVIADFDRDGYLDVFVVGGYATSSDPSLNHGRAYALAVGAGTGPGWPLFHHDVRHSGCSDGYPIPTPAAVEISVETGTLQLSWRPVIGAVCYRVYAGSLAYGDLGGMPIATVFGPAWSGPMPAEDAGFYCVTACDLWGPNATESSYRTGVIR